MGDSDVMVAERLAGKRAVLLFLMAGALIVSELLALESVEKLDRLAVWIVMVVLIALNLTPIGGWLRPSGVMRLLNDESTREHRRASYETGFWVALASALIVAVVASFEPLSGPVVARVVVTAALSAALISFGLRERAAAR